MAVQFGDVNIKVKIDVADSVRDLDRLEETQERVREDGKDVRERQEDPERREPGSRERKKDPSGKGKLKDKVKSFIATLTGAAAAAVILGPIIKGAVESVVEALPVPSNVQETVKKGLDAIISNQVAEINKRLSKITAAFEGLEGAKQLAKLQILSGSPADGEFLAQAGLTIYEVQAAENERRKAIDTLAREALGKGGGKAVIDLLQKVVGAKSN